MRDQRAGRIDDVRQPADADPDARDDVPDELQVHVDHRHAAIAGSARNRHVRLGAFAEAHRPEVRSAGLRGLERRLLRQVGAGGHRVHRQARDPQLLAPVTIDPHHFGDRRHLAQQLEVLDATLFDRVAGRIEPWKRRPPELVLDVEDVALDARCRALRLLDLQRDQVGLVLAPREIQADRAAGDQHAGHQRDDQRGVLREQSAARFHEARRAAARAIPIGDTDEGPGPRVAPVQGRTIVRQRASSRGTTLPRRRKGTARDSAGVARARGRCRGLCTRRLDVGDPAKACRVTRFGAVWLPVAKLVPPADAGIATRWWGTPQRLTESDRVSRGP